MAPRPRTCDPSASGVGTLREEGRECGEPRLGARCAAAGRTARTAGATRASGTATATAPATAAEATATAPAATAAAGPAEAEPAPALADLHRGRLLDLHVPGGMPGALEADLDVVARLFALDLAPAVVRQVLEPALSGLPEPFGAGDLDLQPLVSNFLVITHEGPRVAARPSRRPGPCGARSGSTEHGPGLAALGCPK